MTQEQYIVKRFHEMFGLTINEKPKDISMQDCMLRINLIQEECLEFKESKTLENIADALGDLLYVVYGAAVTYGIDLEPVFDEIHRSNMSKLWTVEEADQMDATLNTSKLISTTSDRCFLVKRKADGKVIKSPSYSPANLKKIIENQQGL